MSPLNDPDPVSNDRVGGSVTTGPPTGAAAPKERSAWFAVSTLGLGAFVVLASEFLPTSVLSLVATDLGISEGLAGQAITSTALTALVAAPTLAGLLPRLDRRTLLAGLMGLALVSNVAVALAPSLPCWWPRGYSWVLP